MNAKELAEHIIKNYETHELVEAIDWVLEYRDRRIRELSTALEAAESILWMAEKYAEGGGMHSIEMEDYQRVKEIIDNVNKSL